MAKKIDANQPLIVQCLRDCGATVVSTATVGKGFPDLIVGYGGRNFLFEIKTEKGKLHQVQQDFQDE